MRCKGMRIPTTSLRTGLGMTGRFKTYASFYTAYYAKIGAAASVYHRHCEEGNARRGNPLLLGTMCGLGAVEGDADSHDQSADWSRNDR